MRSSLLSELRQMTSSRQSPRRSALRHGVALVPLFEEQPVAESRTTSDSFSQVHFEVVVRWSRSPSHHTPKLHERGLRWEILSPLQLYRPLAPPPAAQHS